MLYLGPTATRDGAENRGNLVGAFGGPRWRFAGVLLAAFLTATLGWILPLQAASVRWAASSGRVYVEGPGTMTLSDLVAAADGAPIREVSPGIWQVDAEVIVEDGARLELHSRAQGGDVDELRLRSDNLPVPRSVTSIRADWGTLSMCGIRLLSWDAAVGGPDTEYARFGRAYVGVRSRLAPDGVTALESRMDIVGCEISHLGYDDAESYGLTWKVAGEETPDLFERVDVYGDVRDSRIHHNYFGLYFFGAQGMNIVSNEVAHCVEYGVDPHDDSDQLLIEGNDVHHDGNHGIIASRRCDRLVIRSNVVGSNRNNGIMLHRSSDDCVIEGNRVSDNADAGIVNVVTWSGLRVHPETGLVTIEPVAWTALTGGDRLWRATVTEAGESVRWRLAGLAAGHRYRVSQNGAGALVATAETSGELEWTDPFDVPRVVEYRVAPESRIQIVPATGGPLLEWQGGRLQRAERLGDGEWLDVPEATSPMRLERVSGGGGVFYRVMMVPGPLGNGGRRERIEPSP